MNVWELAAGPVLVQGITGRIGRRHIARMRALGTNIVAGTAPGRGGTEAGGVPVFDTVHQAVAATGASVAVTILPAGAAAEGIMEAAEAGIALLVCVTEGLPLHEGMLALQQARAHGMTVIGPNTPGVLLPGTACLGFLPADFAVPGRCAVLSRSGTLSYEVVFELHRAGIGLSVWIGVGGDPLKGATFAELLPQVAENHRTDSVVLIGEIGGREEEDAVPAIRSSPVPVIGLIAGRCAPEGVPMGHAGALVARGVGSHSGKVTALAGAGARVAEDPRAVARMVRALP